MFDPGLGRSPGGGNGNPLQYSCLENPIDRGAWRATVHGVTEETVTAEQHSTRNKRVTKITKEFEFSSKITIIVDGNSII